MPTFAAMPYSPLTHDAATRRAFRDVWELSRSPYLRDAIEHLLGCAERAWDEETERRLDLVRTVQRGRALADLSIDELCDLLRDTATEARRVA